MRAVGQAAYNSPPHTRLAANSSAPGEIAVCLDRCCLSNLGWLYCVCFCVCPAGCLIKLSGVGCCRLLLGCRCVTLGSIRGYKEDALSLCVLVLCSSPSNLESPYSSSPFVVSLWEAEGGERGLGFTSRSSSIWPTPTILYTLFQLAIQEAQAIHAGQLSGPVGLARSSRLVQRIPTGPRRRGATTSSSQAES